jgi:3-hydroxyanthranilate 3,4-dioxygenase
MFLLPAKTPHNPVRPANSVGLVIERVRKGTGLKDGLMWFCDNCNEQLHATYFDLNNVEKDFQPRFKEFYASTELRTCKSCSQVMEVDQRFA